MGGHEMSDASGSGPPKEANSLAPGDPVRAHLARLWAGLPQPTRLVLAVLGVALTMATALSVTQQLIGAKNIVAMLQMLGWVGGFVVAVVLLALAVVTIVLLVRRHPKAEVRQPPTADDGTGTRADSNASAAAGIVKPAVDQLTAAVGSGVRTHIRDDKIVGRSVELARLRELVKDSRIVTVWGTGGVGKTRLCEEFLGEDAARFAGGAIWVDLDEAMELSDVASRVAAQLGSPLPGDQPPQESVANILADRPSTLVILDNFEHLRGIATQTVQLWAQRAPNCRFVVTSIEQLGLADEKLLVLEPLDVAETKPIAGCNNRPPAIELFCRTADKVGGITMTDQDLRKVAEICRKLDGLPWAIEAAAANLVDFSLDTILENLPDDMLRSPRQDVSKRHQDAQKLVEWSLRLLKPEERTYALQLSAFPGSFCADAVAKAVTRSAEWRARELIGALSKRRLLHKVRQVHGSDRFAMYSIVRLGCEELQRTEMNPEDQRELAERIADYYVEYVGMWDNLIDSDKIAEALDRLESDFENVIQVYGRCLERRDSIKSARLMMGLTGMLRNRREPEDRVSRLERCLPGLRSADEYELAAQVEVEVAVAYSYKDQFTQASEPISSAIYTVLFHRISGRVAGDAHLWNAIIKVDTAASERADKRDTILHQAQLELDKAWDSYADEADDPRLFARVHRERAQVLMARGRDFWDEAMTEIDEADRVLAGHGAVRTQLLIMFTRMIMLSMRGDYDAALELLPEAEVLIRSFAGSYFEPLLLKLRADCWLAKGSLGGDADGSGTRAYDQVAEAYKQLAAETRRTGARRQLLGNLVGEADALIQGSDELRVRRNAPAAMKVLMEADQLASELGLSFERAVILGNQAYLQLELGKDEDAERLAQECVDLMGPEWQRAEENGCISLAILVQAKAALHRKGWQSLAEDVIARYQRLAPEVKAQNAELRRHIDKVRQLQEASTGMTA